MILTAGQGDALLRRQEGANIAFKLGKLGLQNLSDDAVVDDGITVDQDIAERDDARMVMDALELFRGYLVELVQRFANDLELPFDGCA